MQKLKVMEKAKQVAREYRLDTVIIALWRMEKVTESQHNTRSIRNRAEVLGEETSALSQKVDLKIVSSLLTALMGIYLKTS